jgi:hypothetical protein
MAILISVVLAGFGQLRHGAARASSRRKATSPMAHFGFMFFFELVTFPYFSQVSPGSNTNMPITPQYRWSETDETVLVSVGISSANPQKLDVEGTILKISNFAHIAIQTSLCLFLLPHSFGCDVQDQLPTIFVEFGFERICRFSARFSDSDRFQH